jgi:hypothetical protein
MDSERCCQKPCTRGVTHRSLPIAVRNCLTKTKHCVAFPLHMSLVEVPLLEEPGSFRSMHGRPSIANRKLASRILIP